MCCLFMKHFYRREDMIKDPLILKKHLFDNSYGNLINTPGITE